MIFFTMALISALIGASPLLLAKRPKAFGWTAFVYFVLCWIVYYFAMPSLDYSLGGPVLGVTIVLTIIAAIIACVSDGEVEFSWPASTPSIIGIVAVMIALMSGCGACNSGRYSSLAGNIDAQGKTLKHWTQQNQQLSPSHIRIVPQEHAIAIGKTALNQHADDKGNIVGSQFVVAEDYTTLQKVDGELCYVMPLDFKNWGVWNSVSGVPGYVLMNAEDQHALPRYMNGYIMKYTPGACFSQNLERYLYTNGYSDKILMDYSFEIDDSLNPFWVVTVAHHTIGMYSGIVVDGVVVVNPETGEKNYYDKSKAPAWIDRIVPSDIVNTNLGYWGKLLGGYWNNNSFGGQSNLREPETTVLNYGADGTCWYVTPMRSQKTSEEKDDASMTDLIYTNSRTGESIRYSVSGSTEEKILATVDATVKFQNLHGTSVTYENVVDRLTAIVPILAEDHSIRGLALVDVATKSISYDPEPSNALMKYENSLGSLGSALGTDMATIETQFTGKISRISQAAISSGNLYYLYFDRGTHVYVVPQTFHEVLVSQPGDSVMIKFLDTESDLVSVNYFDNLNLTIQASESQKDAIQRTQQRRTNERQDASRNSVKGTIQNGDISNQELDSIAKSLGKKKK
jgi:hypothetical protein